MREITKSALFHSFSAPAWLSVEYGLERRIFLCPFRHILRRRKAEEVRAFFIKKAIFHASILMFAKNAFCKYFFEFKEKYYSFDFNYKLNFQSFLSLKKFPFVNDLVFLNGLNSHDSPNVL